MKPKTEFEPFRNIDWDKYLQSVDEGPMWGTHNDMYADIKDDKPDPPAPNERKDNDGLILLLCFAFIAVVVTVLLVKSAAWFRLPLG